jgi:hypothetical protein
MKSLKRPAGHLCLAAMAASSIAESRRGRQSNQFEPERGHSFSVAGPCSCKGSTQNKTLQTAFAPAVINVHCGKY